MNVLLVEDNGGDRQLIARSIKRAMPDGNVHTADDGVEALAFLRRAPGFESAPTTDFVLLDLELPRKSGFEVLQEIKSDPRLRRIPIVVLTSSDAPGDIARAYDCHASAYFTKPVTDYDQVAACIVSFMRGIQRAGEEVSGLPAPGPPARPPTAAAPARANHHLAAIVESSAEAILSTDLDGTILSWNQATERLYGYTASEAIGRNIRMVVPESRVEELHALLDRVRDGEPVKPLVTERVDRDGRPRVVALSLSPIRDRRGQLVGKSAIVRDITTQRQVEARFRLAVESSPSAMVMVDVDGQIVMINRETERMFGYRRGELVGKSVELLVPLRYRHRHPTLRAGFHSEPEVRAMGAGRDLFAVREDGSEFPVEIGLNPIQLPDGMYVLSAIVDITERKQAEERFRLAVDSSPSGMVMTDAGGAIVLVNAETLRMFGYSREELVGASIDQLVPQRFRGQHPLHRTNFLDSPESRAMGTGRNLYAVRKDGSEFPVEIGLNPIETPQGTVVLSAIVDITERKNREEELARQTKDLARSNAELERFAYVASHDLQEPLRMVASFTSLLEREYADQLDETAREYIAFAVDGAVRMQQLIRDLLAYARLSTRAGDMDPVDVRAAVSSAIEALDLSIREADARINVGDMPTVVGVAHQLRELFQNLIGNAIKFRRDTPPEVTVRANREGTTWLFEVGDNGIGIEPGYIDTVFELFRRLHTRAQYPGTGLGLAICKRIVEHHGGQIWLESIPGSGTTVFFRLPAQQNVRTGAE